MDETIIRVRLSHSLAHCRLERSNFRVELKDCFVYARQHGTWNSLGRTSAWAIFPRSVVQPAGAAIQFLPQDVAFSIPHDNVSWGPFPHYCPFSAGITMTSSWAQWLLKSPVSRLFTQPLIQAQIKENTKAPRHRPLCGQSIGDRWIPITKGYQRGKCFHLMTSSWVSHQSAGWSHTNVSFFVRGYHRSPGNSVLPGAALRRNWQLFGGIWLLLRVVNNSDNVVNENGTERVTWH